jgi:hypothetical protein
VFWDDIVIFDFFGGRTDRKLKKVLTRGEVLPARIDGIKVAVSDGTETHTWGLQVHGDGGTFRAGVRQRLTPHPEHSRLGAEVLVRHYNGRVVVDWPATLEQVGISAGPASILGSPRRRVPPPGIDDRRANRRRLTHGRRTTATLAGAEPVELMGMPTRNWNLRLGLDGREVLVKREDVPEYAVYLLKAGATLPVAVDPKKPDRITVDWVAAAEADAPPGILPS